MPNFLIAIIIIILVVVGLSIYGYWFSRRLSSTQRTEKYKSREDRRKLIKPVSVQSYINPKLKHFLDHLKRALPASYICLPSISLELLYPEEKRESIWLWGHYADIVIFTSGFTPILVIDLIDTTLTGEHVYPMSVAVEEFLKSSGINVLKYTIADTYNINALREAIAKAMNPLL